MKFLGPLLLTFLCFACTQKDTSPIHSETVMTPLEAAGMNANRFGVLFDVRETDELSDGMAQGAIHLPLSRIEKLSEEDLKKEIQSKVKPDQTLIFYCASGKRAKAVAAKLSGLGFKTATMGGFEDWVKAGLPKTQNDAPGSSSSR